MRRKGRISSVPKGSTKENRSPTRQGQKEREGGRECRTVKKNEVQIRGNTCRLGTYTEKGERLMLRGDEKISGDGFAHGVLTVNRPWPKGGRWEENIFYLRDSQDVLRPRVSRRKSEKFSRRSSTGKEISPPNNGGLPLSLYRKIFFSNGSLSLRGGGWGKRGGKNPLVQSPCLERTANSNRRGSGKLVSRSRGRVTTEGTFRDAQGETPAT